MKKEEFIDVSERMVKEYFNRYVVPTNNFQKITVEDVEILAFEEKPDSYKTILTVPNTDDTVYGVTYDKTANKVHSYIYNNDGFRKLDVSEDMEVSKRR